MHDIYCVSAAAFFLAAAGCPSLALAVYRRAERNAEMRILLLMLLVFSLQSFVLFVDALLFGVLNILQEQTHQLLAATALGLQMLIITFVFHFHMVTQEMDREENGLWERPPLKFYLSSRQQRLIVGFVYVVMLISIGKFTYEILRRWQAVAKEPVQTGSFFFIIVLLTLFGFPTLAFYFTYRRKADRTCPNTILPFGDLPGAPVSGDGYKARLVIVIWFGTSGADLGSTWRHPVQLDELSVVLCFLLPAFFMAALIYYKMRFVFFDVLIKRGLIAAALLITSALYYAVILSPAHRIVAQRNAAAGSLTLYAGIILFIACWMALHSRLNGMLDHHLFRRSDYARVVSDISNAMKQIVEPQSLLGAVTDRLRTAVNAEAVRFIPREPSDADASPELPSSQAPTRRQLSTALIPVVTTERVYGHLEFGKRPGGFRYQSEDLAFMTTVAQQLAGMLRNFELRAEREAQRQREQNLRELAIQSELRALRAQINPHFLFNALNTLADLTQEDPKGAEAAILHLSHVFRYALEASRRESVTLGEELDFLDAYLAVECLRFEDKLRYEIDASSDVRGCRIPPMLIQPVVENAVKHGVSRKIEGGRVRIGAALENGRLHIEVKDNGVGFDPTALKGQRGGGVGLENVRSRLEHISGPGSLRINSAPGRGTTISLEMPAVFDADHQDLASQQHF